MMQLHIDVGKMATARIQVTKIGAGSQLVEVPIPIQVTKGVMKTQLQMQELKEELVMGFEVISKRLGQGLIRLEKARVEAATLVFRDIEHIMSEEVIYYSEISTEAEYCAPRRLKESAINIEMLKTPRAIYHSYHS